ncbi:2og-fe oxygenase [Botrytis cinerea]
MSTTTTETVVTSAPEVAQTLQDPKQYDFDHLPKYEHPPETKEDLPWAELVTLDLSDFNNEGGKERLAKQLEHAVHHVGFFYVKNFGLSQDQWTRKPSTKLTTQNADYNGWRRNNHHQVGKVKDNIEIYNIPKFTKDFEGKYAQPPLVQAHLPEIEVFSKALHSNVVLPLLRLFAIILQLPDEEYLVNQHTYDKKSEDHFRYMIYHKRTPEEHEASGYGQTTGHTDLGTVTLLFRQPVAGLQILGDDGNWTWVSAQPGTITVNLADTISHLTGGWLKSSIHRVVAPPKDQWEYERTGLLYFARPHNDTILKPILDSPVLKEAGVKPRFEKEITMEEWVRAKQRLQLNPDLAKGLYQDAEDGTRTVEVIGGFRDRTYK